MLCASDSFDSIQRVSALEKNPPAKEEIDLAKTDSTSQICTALKKKGPGLFNILGRAWLAFMKYAQKMFLCDLVQEELVLICGQRTCRV